MNPDLVVHGELMCTRYGLTCEVSYPLTGARRKTCSRKRSGCCQSRQLGCGFDAEGVLSMFSIVNSHLEP